MPPILRTNPICIFCGGAAQATTKEHCPPRSLFQSRNWPEGFEFPACKTCNAGTADDDVLIALIGRMDPITNAGNSDGKVNGLMYNANKQHPGLLQQMMNMSAVEARKAAKALNIKPSPGLTYQQAGILNVTGHMDKAVSTLASKLSKAIYFMTTGHIFPATGSIQLHWFTNADLFRYGKSPVLDAFAKIEAPMPKLMRNGKDLCGQFDYRFSLSEKNDLAVLRAVFGKAFGLVTIMSPEYGYLQKIDAELQAKVGKEVGPFKFL